MSDGILLDPYRFAVESPADIADLRAWYEADSIGLADADPVSTWADLSGNGFDLTQTLAARPTYRTALVNGHAAVDFDGSDDSLARTFEANPSGTWTAFAVAKSDTLSGTRLIVNHDNAVNMTRAGQFLRTNSTALEAVSFNWDGVLISRTDAAGVTLSTGTWYVLESLRPSTPIEVFVNGSGNGPAASATGTPNHGSQDFRLGAFHNSTLFFDGQLAEVLVYDRALTSIERDDVRAYLASKYGI